MQTLSIQKVKNAIRCHWPRLQEGLLLVALMAVATLIAYEYDIFPNAPGVPTQERVIEPDEMLALAVLLCVCLLVLSWRFLLLHRREMARRIKVDYQQKNLLDAAVENMSQGLCMFDADWPHRAVQRALCQDDGFAGRMAQGQVAARPDQVSGKTAGEFAGDPEEFFARVIADAREGKSSTRIMEDIGRSGASRGRPADAGRRLGCDLRGHYRMAESSGADLAHGASRCADRLGKSHPTGRKIGECACRPSLRGGSIAVHFIDLDRFKNVNDTLGHDGGDFLLKTVAERLRSVTRIDDMVARLGGDEFVVVQTGVNGRDQAEDFARRLVV